MNYSEDFLVDFHCHLDLFPDFPDSYQKAQNAGVATLAVTTTPFAFQKNQDLAANLPLLRVGLGLHPQIVGSRHASLIEFEKLLPSARYIGEVGLDAGPAHYGTFKQQLDIFSNIIRLASEHGGKIISIHSVRSVRQVLDILEQFQCQKQGTIAILHWFTGSASELSRGVNLGCYFSINNAMLEKPKNAALIKTIPITRILTETDAPFTKHAGRSARPNDVKHTVRTLAGLFIKSEETMRKQVWSNLLTIEGKANPPDADSDHEL